MNHEEEYDQLYETTRDVFGEEPEETLVRFAGDLNPDLPILDVGAGQGRNALYLARRGFRIDALDPSRVSVETVEAAAAQEDLPIACHPATLETFEPPELPYGGILIYGLLQILTREAIGGLVRTVEEWTAPFSLLFLTAWTTEDEAYRRLAEEGTPMGRHSYRRADGEIRTYFAPGELPGLFPAFEPIHHEEFLGPLHTHGDSPPECHFKVEAVLSKR